MTVWCTNLPEEYVLRQITLPPNLSKRVLLGERLIPEDAVGPRVQLLAKIITKHTVDKGDVAANIIFKFKFVHR